MRAGGVTGMMSLSCENDRLSQPRRHPRNGELLHFTARALPSHCFIGTMHRAGLPVLLGSWIDETYRCAGMQIHQNQFLPGAAADLKCECQSRNRDLILVVPLIIARADRLRTLRLFSEQLRLRATTWGNRPGLGERAG